MEIPECHTIFLKGVFFSEVRTVEEKLLEESLQPKKESCLNITNHNTIDLRLSRFKNTKQWAEAFKDQTLKCWYCGLNFKGVPCFIPLQIKTTPKGREYDTYGLFCGFACAFAHLQANAEFVRNKTYFDKLTMLKILFSDFYHKRICEFIAAPNVYDLSVYGGYMDFIEYRKELKNINSTILNNATPIIQNKSKLL